MASKWLLFLVFLLISYNHHFQNVFQQRFYHLSVMNICICGLMDSSTPEVKAFRIVTYFHSNNILRMMVSLFRVQVFVLFAVFRACFRKKQIAYNSVLLDEVHHQWSRGIFFITMKIVCIKCIVIHFKFFECGHRRNHALLGHSLFRRSLFRYLVICVSR